MSIPDGIMLGFVINPESGETQEIVMHGSPMDLMRIVALLGLDMRAEDRESIMNDTRRHEDGPLTFTDDKGSYVTLQPSSRASDFLANAAETAYRNGLPFPF